MLNHLVIGGTPFYRMNWNIIIRTSNELEHVHVWVIKLEQPHSDFEQTDIEPKGPN